MFSSSPGDEVLGFFFVFLAAISGDEVGCDLDVLVL